MTQAKRAHLCYDIDSALVGTSWVRENFHTRRGDTWRLHLLPKRERLFGGSTLNVMPPRARDEVRFTITVPKGDVTLLMAKLGVLS